MNNSIDVVLFDLGRVLMEIDFDAFPNGLGLYTGEQRAPYITPTRKLWHAYETGILTTEEFVDAIRAIFAGKFLKEKILEAWDGIIVRDNEAIIPFVRSVQKKYRTAILSNTSPSHWEKALRVSSIVPTIQECFTSFSIGAMKPEKRVYNYVARSLNVPPDRIVFIDDLEENILGAREAGMKGLVFHNTTQIETDFAKYF